MACPLGFYGQNVRRPHKWLSRLFALRKWGDPQLSLRHILDNFPHPLPIFPLSFGIWLWRADNYRWTSAAVIVSETDQNLVFPWQQFLNHVLWKSSSPQVVRNFFSRYHRLHPFGLLVYFMRGTGCPRIDFTHWDASFFGGSPCRAGSACFGKEVDFSPPWW